MNRNEQPSVPDPAELDLRAELHLCLGRAFLPPSEPELEQALVEALPHDLRALNEALGYTAESNPERFAASARKASSQPEGLIRLYSRLFLAPPFPAAINAGIHLDGSLMGASVVGMEDFYFRHGLEKDREFKDLPDHLALQLQFVAYLLELAAEALRAGEDEKAADLLTETAAFEQQYMKRWLPLLITDMEKAEAEYEVPAAYRYLAVMALDAVACDLEAWSRWPGRSSITESAEADQEPAGRPAAASGERAACRCCGNEYLPAAELAQMVQALEARGLSTEHLTVCPDCSAAEMGLSPTGLKLPDAVRRQTER